MQHLLALSILILLSMSTLAAENVQETAEINKHYSPWSWAAKVASQIMKAESTGGKQQGTCDVCGKGAFPDEGIIRLGGGRKGYRHWNCDYKWKKRMQHKKKKKH